jgi:DNA-binding IclR family transcriptional regulator
MIDDSPGDDATETIAGNKATARVLTVLSAFLDAPGSLGISEISRSLGMTKSMVQRALATLVNHNYVVRDETGTRYQLGYAVADFGMLSTPTPDLHLLCRPTMRELNELTGATVSLTIPVRDHAVCIDGLIGSGPVARAVPLGFSLPLHISAAARCLLASLPDDEIRLYLANPPVTPEVPAPDPDEVWRDVERIRRDGFALGVGNYAPTSVVTGVGFPVLDMNGDPHASLTIAGPAARFPRELIDELLPTMLELLARLGRESRLYIAEREPIR